MDYIIDSYASLPVSGQTFVVGYKGEQVEDFVKRRNFKNSNVVYQRNPQGLGEAVSLCMPFFSDAYWNALDADNKVSLLVKWIDRETFDAKTLLVNKLG